MEIRKNLYKYVIAAIMLAPMMSSCEKQLEEIQPQQEVSTDLAFNDELSSFGSLMGVYSRAQFLDAFGGTVGIISEYQPDNVEFIGSFITLQEINNFAAIASNSTIEVIWRDHYRTIFAANAVILNVPNVEVDGFTVEEKAQFVAEAKFMRALSYFQLVNIFGQPFQVSNGGTLGVPLVTEPFNGTIELPTRATVAEVHALIKSDLEAGVADLADDLGDPLETRGRATKGAARAMLSRLHLYRGEWDQAASFARQVIDAGLYDLASDHSFWSSKNTSETIFAIQNSATDNGATGSGGWASFTRPAQAGGRGDAPFSQDLIDAHEAGDARLAVSSEQDGVLFSLKFSDAITNADNVSVIRTTEVYLNLAEALAESSAGVNSEALAIVNQLRTRAGLGNLAPAPTTKQELVDAILNERRLELAFEGHRRMDLLRKEKALRVDGPFAAQAVFGGPKTILPIPTRERDANPNLEQNPSY
ncbi:RagB/SusD family nutrient uptake outer membrane protein [Bernardetia sp. OM2101]|uniref:RagB/SusD family nutrient uptake outer membrane protein n=1 Tax=Bernardetia sp. OM2101 TaxID=3344876 RepID=UPI0035D0E04C